MSTTAELVDEKIELVDGSASSADLSLKRRWRSYLQVSATLIWNDRFWEFKVAEDQAFSYNPAIDNPMPADWGSFEALGAGVYTITPRRQLEPKTTGEMTALRFGQEQATSAEPKVFNVYYLLGVPYLRLWPTPAATTTVVLTYLRKAPKLWYADTIVDSGTDELYFIPEQWHQLVGWGGEWLNKQKTANSLASAEQQIWKAGLDEMRAREACVVRGIQPWRPSRMGRRG